MDGERLNANGNKAFLGTHRNLQCVRQMPELRHKVGDAFDINKSEVVKWLIEQPEVRQYIFDLVRGGDKRREQLIAHDPERGTWKGVGST